MTVEKKERSKSDRADSAEIDRSDYIKVSGIIANQELNSDNGSLNERAGSVYSNN